MSTVRPLNTGLRGPPPTYPLFAASFATVRQSQGPNFAQQLGKAKVRCYAEFQGRIAPDDAVQQGFLPKKGAGQPLSSGITVECGCND